jgi:lysyl-tRNA synthetase class II
VVYCADKTGMEDTNSLIEQRKAKLAALRAKGIDPFKNKFSPTESCDAAREKYKRGEYNDAMEISVAGRITAHREMGKSMFIDVRDQSGRIQIYAQKNALGDEQWEIFKHLDLGDFVGVRGTLFTTKTGEISIKLGSGAAALTQKTEANEADKESSLPSLSSVPPFVILAKALRPPPEKWHGLADTEIRYRQRYLDLMANPAVKDVMLMRSEIIREIRNYFHQRGFVEVETPMMQAIPGGAAAQPFITRHNALGCNFYLRIALELYLKRLLVGGVDKVFEIGRNFRNEGLSRKHNPEFTMLEAYQAFGDYETMMKLVEEMICHVAQKVLGTLLIEHQLKRRFKKELQNTTEALDRLYRKLAEDYKESTKNKLVRKDFKNFEQAFESSLRTLELLAHPNNQTRFDEAIQQATQSFGNCSAQAQLLRIAPEMGMELKEIGKSTTEFFAFLEQILPQFGSLKIEAEKNSPESLNKIIDLTPPWRRVKYKDLVREKAGADWFDISPAERRQRAHDLGAEITKDYADFEVTGAVFEKLIEPTLIQPTFVTHLPKELVPLAKLSPDDPTTVEVFECCINGQEIAPAYTEQNDPIEQRERLEHQAGGEQQKLDEDFLVALEHGMPPAGGMGMGIDRLCMMLLGQESIRDVILFPQLKPK